MMLPLILKFLGKASYAFPLDFLVYSVGIFIVISKNQVHFFWGGGFIGVRPPMKSDIKTYFSLSCWIIDGIKA